MKSASEVRRMADKEQMKMLRDQGLKYAEIARICGVSRQYVYVVCGKASHGHFTPISCNACVYPHLRKWLNENKVSKAEFFRRMGFTINPKNYGRLESYLSGKCQPRKSYIDRMLRVTGMNYETLFYTEAEED